ncbi:hypothetical protein [Geminocystis herdmanii]|uniref:hypothetical protein n=1 Tax=Geminocystis herdmanii TaxID=669359 RepID=UPI000590459E|nr:hypothetical protein [Geminocystis herdmanii]
MLQNVQLPFAYLPFAYLHQTQVIPSPSIPLSLEGRPTHFSGLEIIGCNLEKQAIADTLGDFCLEDSAVYFYQQQVKESLSN